MIYHVDYVANISAVIKTGFDDLEFNMMWLRNLRELKEDSKC